MGARSIISRLSALPLRHKLIAVAIEAMAIGGCVAWLQHFPPAEYSSSALLFFDSSAAARAGVAEETGSNPAQVTQLARSILSDDAVSAISTEVGLNSDGRGSAVSRFRSALSLSRESTSSLRVTWRGTDRNQATVAANEVALRLMSWSPAVALPGLAAPGLASTDGSDRVGSTHPAGTFTPILPPEPRSQIAIKVSQLKARLEEVVNYQNELRLELANIDQKQSKLSEEQHRLEVAVKKASDERLASTSARQPLMAQLAAEKKKLEALRVRYTDAYPDVEAAQERIAEMEDKLAALPATHSAVDADQSRLNTLTREINNLGADRARLLRQLAEEARLEEDLSGQVFAALKQEAKVDLASTSLQSEQSKLPPVNADAPLAPPRASQENVASPEGDEVHAFRILVPAGRAQATHNPRQLLRWLAMVAGSLSGILYLVLAVWWFRAVRNVESLERIVPSDIAYLGGIPGIQTWRHNV